MNSDEIWNQEVYTNLIWVYIVATRCNVAPTLHEIRLPSPNFSKSAH